VSPSIHKTTEKRKIHLWKTRKTRLCTGSSRERKERDGGKTLGKTPTHGKGNNSLFGKVMKEETLSQKKGGEMIVKQRGERRTSTHPKTALPLNGGGVITTFLRGEKSARHRFPLFSKEGGRRTRGDKASSPERPRGGPPWGGLRAGRKGPPTKSYPKKREGREDGKLLQGAVRRSHERTPPLLSRP